MKVVVPTLTDETLYTCDGRVAIEPGAVITGDTFVPCPHGHAMKFGHIEFDSWEEYEEWLASET